MTLLADGDQQSLLTDPTIPTLGIDGRTHYLLPSPSGKSAFGTYVSVLFCLFFLFVCFQTSFFFPSPPLIIIIEFYSAHACHFLSPIALPSFLSHHLVLPSAFPFFPSSPRSAFFSTCLITHILSLLLSSFRLAFGSFRSLPWFSGSFSFPLAPPLDLLRYLQFLFSRFFFRFRSFAF
jgi:hypothetical protein